MQWVYLSTGLLFSCWAIWSTCAAGISHLRLQYHAQREKAKVNTKALGRLMGHYAYANGSLFLLLGILRLFFEDKHHLGLCLFGLSTVYLLVKAQKYGGNIFDQEGKLRPKPPRNWQLLWASHWPFSWEWPPCSFISCSPPKCLFWKKGCRCTASTVKFTLGNPWKK